MSKQSNLVNNSQDVTVDASGNVGIGYSSPAGNYGKNLQVHTAATSGSSLQLTDGTTGGGVNDGFQLICTNGLAYLWNRETSDMVLATSNTERMRIDSSGAVTMPAQPSFHVRKNADQNNIATGTAVTVLWQVESYDVGANFASNTFTAPVAGKYILTASIRVDSLDSTASEHNDMTITTSNRTYKNIFDLRGLSADPAYWTFTINAVADMDKDDTAFIQFYQDGGTAQSDIKNDAGRTYFSGILVG